MEKTGQNKFGNLPGPGPGRPKGSQAKVTIALKEAILRAGEEAGGKEGLVGYLKMLARDNSSAYAGLLGKILPSTLAADADSHGGAGVEIRVSLGRSSTQEAIARSRAKHPSSCRLHLPIRFPTAIRRLLNRQIVMISQILSVLRPSVSPADSCVLEALRKQIMQRNLLRS